MTLHCFLTHLRTPNRCYTGLKLLPGKSGSPLMRPKTQYILYNNVGEMFTLGGDKLKCVHGFQCLGSWVGNTSKDMETRIAKAWSASSKLNKIWKSSLSRELKIQFFRAAVESVLLYGAECWTLTNTLTKRLDGAYTSLQTYSTKHPLARPHNKSSDLQK